MKLNIFRIPKDKVEGLKRKFNFLNLENINSSSQKGWKADFYFSKNVQPILIPWVATYSDFFLEEKPANRVYFSTYIWENEKYCFAIGYGKAHFYLRQFCDHDFGIEIAKRIANQKDVRQKSSKKFAGKKKKEIKSYTKNSKLDIESGESIDYLQSSIAPDHKIVFGNTGKFGSSVLLNPDIEKDKLPDFLEFIVKTYESPELFKLPRTTILPEDSESNLPYEEKLLEAILSSKDDTDFTDNGHDLIGVDFTFAGHEKYKFLWDIKTSRDFTELSIAELNQFISKYSIPKKEILNIKLQISKEDAKSFSKTLKESIDYIVDQENVLLSQGKWMQFNEDYIDQLNEYIDEIALEEVENDLLEIPTTEGDFNRGAEKYGYTNADKDFSKIKIKSSTPIEAWDLKKGDTVYAVKFGTAQKLGYVCDQAMNTLELISKKANIKKLNTSFKNYCVWLVFNNKNRPNKLSEVKSIILKQKIESWARKSLELGIIPKIKISRHL